MACSLTTDTHGAGVEILAEASRENATHYFSITYLGILIEGRWTKELYQIVYGKGRFLRKNLKEARHEKSCQCSGVKDIVI